MTTPADSLSPAARDAIRELKGRYPSPRSALIPALMAAQEDAGYLSAGVLEEVGGLLDVAPAEVEAVASFYTLLHLQPVGRHVVQVCTNIACHLRGARGLLQHALDTLGIPLGGTTPDGLFTVEKVECIAACGGAPAVQIDLDYHENVTPRELDRLLEDLRRKAPPRA